MKVISLWQSWASLVALGEKAYETRSWSTSYRGPLVIHASKKWDASLRWYARQTPFREVLARHGYDVNPLPLGCALCVVDLVDVLPTAKLTYVTSPSGFANEITLQEYDFGNYAPGRFAWKLENVRRFPEPVPLRGAQGLFEWPEAGQYLIA